MEFLKSIFADKAMTYDEFVTAINAHNGDEANKENQLKIGNLGSGDYVSKAKYDSLQALFDGKSGELDTANGLIAELKKGAANDEAVQAKISGYETQIAQLQGQLRQTQIENAINLAIRDAKGLDADYLAYKMKALGDIELDDDGKIKGIEEKITNLKAQCPTQFESGAKKVEEHKLPNTDTSKNTITKSELMKMPYSERAKFYESNPEGYTAAMNS